jgi:hypothetical protein
MWKECDVLRLKGCDEVKNLEGGFIGDPGSDSTDFSGSTRISESRRL